MTGLTDRLARLRLIVFDLDGVFTDGRFLLDEDGREYKTFHTQDGYGVRRLLEAGVQVAIISGRRSGAVDRRMTELGVTRVVQGCRHKVPELHAMADDLGIDLAEVAYVGDDLPDLEAMRACGLAIAVANAVEGIVAEADYVTARGGGD
ncbi:MAG: HAD-IIIA family hydrolase, partial [Gammaproteobacteria bacterium]|nr:HAD-IIIA family hydrolase [Gammaproteobacteria bacterium]